MTEKHSLSIFAEFDTEAERDEWFGENIAKYAGIDEPVFSYSTEDESRYRDMHTELVEALEKIANHQEPTRNSTYSEETYQYLLGLWKQAIIAQKALKATKEG